MDENSYDVIIIGAGAAGLSAALVLGRARRRVLVLDGGPPRNALAAQVNGYLGIDGLSPQELLAAGRTQVEKLGVHLLEEGASGVDVAADGLVVCTAGGDFTARRLVLAAGISDELPDIAGLREGFGVDVLHCPYCHGLEVAHRRLGVLATQPMSGHQARMIRQWSADVTFFLNDTVELDAEERRSFAARGVKVVDGPVAEVIRDGGVLTAVRDGDGVEHEIDALFAAPAMRLNDDALAGLDLELSDTPFGPVVAVDPTGRTNVPGIWAVGNITNPATQVITAAASGSWAGAQINASLTDEEWAVS